MVDPDEQGWARPRSISNRTSNANPFRRGKSPSDVWRQHLRWFWCDKNIDWKIVGYSKKRGIRNRRKYAKGKKNMQNGRMSCNGKNIVITHNTEYKRNFSTTTRAQRKQNASKTQASFAEQRADKNQATCSWRRCYCFDVRKCRGQMTPNCSPQANISRSHLPRFWNR